MKIEDFSKRDLQEAMAEAAEHRLISFADKRDSIMKHMESGRELSGYTLPWAKTFNHIRIRNGELSVLCGFNGHMKSTIANMLMLSAARFGDKTDPESKKAKVGICSFEMGMEDIYECMAMQFAGSGQKPSVEFQDQFLDWSRDRLVIYDQLGVTKPMRVLGAIVALANAGCDFIVLDSLMFCGGVTHDLQAEEEFCQALCGIARMERIHIMLIHHSRKGDETLPPTKEMVKGSGGIGDMASTVYLVWNDKYKGHLIRKRDEFGYDLDEKETKYLKKPCQKLVVVKQRYGKFEDSLSLFSHPSRQFLERPSKQAIHFDFSH